MIVLRTVYAEAHQPATVHEAQPVPVVEYRSTRHHYMVAPYLLDKAHTLPHALWRNHVAQIIRTAMHEIIRISAVERTVHVRSEEKPLAPKRRAAVLPATNKYRIQMLTIPRRHVLDVSNILQPPLYLQRGHTRIQQRLQVIRAVHVTHAQQITLRHPTAIPRLQRIAHPAELSTLAPVCTAPVAHLRSIAAPVVAHTYRTVYKYLQRHIRHLGMHPCNLVNRQLACKHHLPVALSLTLLHYIRIPVIHLRTGMKHPTLFGIPAPVHFHQTMILAYHSIHTYAEHRMRQLHATLQLLVVQQRIQRHVHPDTELMRIPHDLHDILRTVARSSPGTEFLRTNVHRIRPMIYGSKRSFPVPCRSQQFDIPHQ